MKLYDLSLKNLQLINIATFANESVAFESGLNVIVGETGSGKSLLLDSLQLIFGGRSDKKLIRKGADFACVEATLQTDSPDVKQYFDELGHPFDGNEVIIKRMIYTNGRSRSFLNYQGCSTKILIDIAKRFTDLVGQFENQKLLSDSYQLDLLDRFAKIEPIKSEYSKSYDKYQELRNQLEELENKSIHAKEREDYIAYQVKQIERLDPTTTDEANLIKQKESALNQQERMDRIQKINLLLSDDSNSVFNGIKEIIKAYSSIPNANEKHLEKLYECEQFLQDFSYDISKSDENINEDTIEDILERLNLYQSLKRKFNCDTNGLVELFNNFKKELEDIQQIDQLILTMKKSLHIAKDDANNLATKLHKRRVSEAKKLSAVLTETIQSLKMDGASIEIQLEKIEELNKRGCSKLNLMAETNRGEGIHSLKEVASGGELSRILLALRQVISSEDTISIFLFDEIDTGIGGETALAIGKALKSVSFNSQVLAITHLPQIASFSDHLIQISKKESQSSTDDIRTNSYVTLVTPDKKAGFIESMTPLH